MYLRKNNPNIYSLINKGNWHPWSLSIQIQLNQERVPISIISIFTIILIINHLLFNSIYSYHYHHKNIQNFIHYSLSKSTSNLNHIQKSFKYFKPLLRIITLLSFKYQSQLNYQSLFINQNLSSNINRYH